MPVMFSSHQLSLVERVCDRVGIVGGGRLIACGTVRELSENADRRLPVDAPQAGENWTEGLAGVEVVSREGTCTRLRLAKGRGRPAGAARRAGHRAGLRLRVRAPAADRAVPRPGHQDGRGRGGRRGDGRPGATAPPDGRRATGPGAVRYEHGGAPAAGRGQRPGRTGRRTDGARAGTPRTAARPLARCRPAERSAWSPGGRSASRMRTKSFVLSTLGLLLGLGAYAPIIIVSQDGPARIGVEREARHCARRSPRWPRRRATFEFVTVDGDRTDRLLRDGELSAVIGSADGRPHAVRGARGGRGAARRGGPRAAEERTSRELERAGLDPAEFRERVATSTVGWPRWSPRRTAPPSSSR